MLYDTLGTCGLWNIENEKWIKQNLTKAWRPCIRTSFIEIQMHDEAQMCGIVKTLPFSNQNLS